MPVRRPVSMALSLLAALLAAVVCLSCSRQDSLARWAPDLDPGFRAALATSDANLAAYARQRGEPVYNLAWEQLSHQPIRGNARAASALLPTLRRMAAVFADEFDIDFARRVVAMIEQVPPAELARLFGSWQDHLLSFADASVPDSTRARQAETLWAEATASGVAPIALALGDDLARIHADMGQAEVARRWLERTAALATEWDHPWSYCQAIGTLSQLHFEAGRLDEAYHCLDLAEARARRSQLAYQAARAISFRSAYNRSAGGYGAANLLLREAREVCRQYKGGGQETRYAIAQLRFYQELGCWSLMERLIPEAKILDAQPPRMLAPHRLASRTGWLMSLQASALFETGRQEEALALMEELVAFTRPRPYREHYSRNIRDRTDMLLESGHPRAALREGEQGLRRAADDNLAGFVRDFQLLLARCAFALGDTAAARRHLAARGAEGPHGEGAYLHDLAAEQVLRLRLARHAGDEAGLVAALAEAFAAVVAAVNRSDNSVATYLALEAFDPVRWVVHEILADDPALGLDFDLAWRGLARARAAVGRADVSGLDPTAREWLGSWSGHDGPGSYSSRLRRQQATAGDGTAHLQYVVTDTEVLCWYGRNGQLDRGSLAVSPDSLRLRLAGVLTDLAAAAGAPTAPCPAALAAALAHLAADLLPADLRNAPPARLLVAADDVLEALPVAALPRTGVRYHPLGLETAVVCLRYDRAGAPYSGGGRDLIVATPTLAPELRRLQPELVHLPGALGEGRAATAAWRDAIFLHGDEADLRNVTSAAARARRIWVAGHVVRDPAAPFLSYLPLAAPAGSLRIEDSLLEMRDVLALDLEDCALVVLAGCSSGTPYVAGTRTAPGFGDIFVDAGARLVVQSLWRLDDQRLAPRMAEFARRHDPGGDVWQTATDLRLALRPAMVSGGRASHPFNWASLVIVSADPGF